MHKEHRQHLKSNNIILKFVVIVLSIVLLTGFALVPALQLGVNGQVQQQQQQQQHLAFRQAPEESVAGEQTFRSAFDTFVSSEPGGYGIYEERKSNVFNPGETFLLYVEPQVIHMVQ